jgi:hypothetical protein
VILLSREYYGGQGFAADLDGDQVVDLTDVVLLTEAMGAVCP